eukprot:CAMPEP_0177431940 /NCGR_PEP_ID=MMETSP0368-20130122/76438_1 /TAXON_ID=447022 ORGANISM="Scrippsiella hangoei-like, Strain SHHI-4" /NCGR_SAMPLE_ID=MMETSP0368 /ASSEMBLY_ACC=CAM_ASM_000363 /LENGTH=143 /DNA_ID=CAMNT_0018902595 /DNA_START=85 /DNA_END=513 /DNA_ORIENTATION=+
MAQPDRYRGKWRNPNKATGKPSGARNTRAPSSIAKPNSTEKIAGGRLSQARSTAPHIAASTRSENTVPGETILRGSKIASAFLATWLLTWAALLPLPQLLLLQLERLHASSVSAETAVLSKGTAAPTSMHGRRRRRRARKGRG